jgi:hypothetical protein
MFKIKPHSNNYIYKTAEEQPQGEASPAEGELSAVETVTDSIGLVMSKEAPEGATLNIKYLRLLGGGRPVNVQRTEERDKETGVTTVTLTDTEWSGLQAQMPQVGELDEAFGGQFGRTKTLYHRRINLPSGQPLVWATFKGVTSGLRENPKVYYTKGGGGFLITATGKHKPLQNTRFASNWGMINYDGITTAFNIAIEKDSEHASESGGPVMQQPREEATLTEEVIPTEVATPTEVEYFYWESAPNRIHALLPCGADGSSYVYEYATNEEVIRKTDIGTNLPEGDWVWAAAKTGQRLDSPESWVAITQVEGHQLSGLPFPLLGNWDDRKVLESWAGAPLDKDCAHGLDKEELEWSRKGVEGYQEEGLWQPSGEPAIEVAEEAAEATEIGEGWESYISDTAAKWYGGEQEPRSLPESVAKAWFQNAASWDKETSYDDWKQWYREQHETPSSEGGERWHFGKTIRQILRHNKQNKNDPTKMYRFMSPEESLDAMVKGSGSEVDDYLSNNVWDKRKFSSLVPGLTSLANHLDATGHREEASYIDNILMGMK